MKWILAVVMTVFFMSGSEAFAHCASSALLCTKLSTLEHGLTGSVVHPCTTFDGAAGTWACPGADELKDPDEQPAPAASVAKKSRGMTTQ